ncbi:S41 family peptidase [Alteromonas oceanisediminis]|uniref:S41 family peptidase n=1 Tax=Alteromonas oceanisediminis TaxID=2836180 RepID=UPI001BDAAAF9|nr:S41 family peptidase [Alteromonas oceanisediminis]MBT0587827.1 PD40 domain-containing protein [Alteromonas oceanisediminis]
MKIIITFIFAASLAMPFLSEAAEPGYYRAPSLHSDTLVFTAEGDIWRMQLGDSHAMRLTTHPAEEHSAVISPDGNQIAFAANYEGATEVYTMPMRGGVAKRVTFENHQIKLHAWSEDGILFATANRIGTAGSWVLKRVNPDTLKSTVLPVANAVEGDIDNSTLVFAQHGLQVSTDNANRYRGGAKGELWRFELNTDREATHLTAAHAGSVRSPMIAGDKVYFISNDSGLDNIWSMTIEGKALEQVTQFDDWAVREPMLNNGRIAFQHGADIKILTLATGQVDTIQPQLISDFPALRENWINQPLKQLESARYSGAGDRVTLTARGHSAVAGITSARLTPIATDAKARTRQAILGHEGKWVYALSDASGETEIWRFSADGKSSATQLTFDGSTMRWSLYPSPDGKWIAHDDKAGNLWLLNLESGKNTAIIDDNTGLDPISDVVWSNDSHLLAITYRQKQVERPRILLYSLAEQKQRILTSEKYESYSPAFSSDNQWLYFLSDRDFIASPSAPWGDRNMGPMFDRRTKIYAVSLDPSADFAFQPPNELTDARASEKNNAATEQTQLPDSESEEQGANPPSPTKIAWDNIAQRLWEVPMPSGNYAMLSMNEKFLFVRDRVSEPNSKPVLKSLALSHDAKPETFAEGIVDYRLSYDGKRMFVRKEGGDNANLFIVDAAGTFPKDTKNAKVHTAQWKLVIDPRQEWQQIFRDAWLMHRDSLFDATMRGLDWQATREKYTPLLARITDRHELNDIFEQMMGELNTLHSQVRGGDVSRDKDAPKPADLGAVFEDADAGLIVSHIYRTDPELPSDASPLNQPGVDVSIGDVLIAVNNQPVEHNAALATQLRNQAGKQVLLTLTRKGESFNAVVTPVSAQQAARLRYQDWTMSNLEKVTKASADIGYLHLYAMGGRDIAHFAREFYAQYDKPALIIDVRGNRGGNIDAWILEKLLKRTWAFWQSTNGEQFTNMQQTFRGHLVVLADEFTYSDGETFTAGVKALDLGTVIGKQTAGAGVWLSGRNRLVDGGIARVAEFPVFNTDGQFIVEGHGVEPDVEVDNLPHATFNGNDVQLQEAIKWLTKRLKDAPVKPLKAKPFPTDMGPGHSVRNPNR